MIVSRLEAYSVDGVLVPEVHGDPRPIMGVELIREPLACAISVLDQLD